MITFTRSHGSDCASWSIWPGGSVTNISLEKSASPEWRSSADANRPQAPRSEGVLCLPRKSRTMEYRFSDGKKISAFSNSLALSAQRDCKYVVADLGVPMCRYKLRAIDGA